MTTRLIPRIVNPRLSDVFGLVIRQDEVDFVVPHLREDLPLYLDPCLLRKSEDPQYRRLHADLLGFVEEVRRHRACGVSWSDGRAVPYRPSVRHAWVSNA